MTSFSHAMPFGAQLRTDGTVRFRLWAPAQESASISIDDAITLSLQRLEGGWFEVVTEAAKVGSRYRFVLQDGIRVPDPASRHQPDDVHGPSVVVDPGAYAWQTAGWRGLPWHESVIYELHVGAFDADGTFDGVRRRLDRLERLGVTVIELMPPSDFAGRRNWGYDGVLPFAPDSSYGTPAALKALIDSAHERRMMVFLDVVYNHFGPDGNYLRLYAPQFFTERRHTPWGAAIDYAQRPVRDFIIHNALYWLDEYRVDGLRLDAVHAIVDESPTHILAELAAAVRDLGVRQGRHLHLVLENDENAARWLRPGQAGAARLYDAQWNDDFHHACHVLLTRESAGYYADYVDQSVAQLGRALTEGFIYQGEPSRHRANARRGEPSGDLPHTAFIGFLQNHDQIGNRAFGERLTTLAAPRALEAMAAVLLLAPHVPLLFMGEEWGTTRPFPFFCDFPGELGAAVRVGRRREFAKFPAFSDPEARAHIPDPNSPATFAQAALDWEAADRTPHHERLALYQRLLALRRSEIVPCLAALTAPSTTCELLRGEVLQASWLLGDGARLTLIARLCEDPAKGEAIGPAGRLLHSTHPELARALPAGELPGWFVAWFLTEEPAGTVTHSTSLQECGGGRA